MSCIAGPHQFGIEDQGWVAHFLYSVLERKAITIYGDGFQVRDVLHVYDLLDAFEAAWHHSDHCTGETYNLGGGFGRSVSIAEMLEIITHETGISPILRHSALRTGDQTFYISDTNKFSSHTGWNPRLDINETLRSILKFWNANNNLLPVSVTSQ